MNIEESVTYIKEKIKNKLPEYTETFVDGKPYRIDVLQLETRWTEKTAEAIETLLTAYENLKSYNKGTKEALRVAEDLEHQANKEAGDWEARCFKLEAELEKEKEKNKKIENELEKHIKFCEQEAEGIFNNEVCHISLRFNKKLLNILKGEE